MSHDFVQQFGPMRKKTKSINGHDIAVVGMAGIFPGAGNIKTFWKNILHQVNSVKEVDPDRWSAADLFDPDPKARDRIYSKWGGFLDDVLFDPTQYGIPPISLKYIEVMQLLALKVAHTALLDAGFEKRAFPRHTTAVIFGSGGTHDISLDYIFRTMLIHYMPKLRDLPEATKTQLLETCKQHLPEWSEDTFPGILSNVISGRVANRLDLSGSNFTVDAACASSLAALDVGISKLRTHQADAALVGAVDISDNILGFTAFAKTMVLSPDGRSRPFDQQANGIVISEGVGALVLKRLSDALKNGDTVHAVIKGIGSSSDGKNRSLTAPHPEGQMLALKRAYEDAGIAPGTIGMIEAHGTGTVVGDQSEIESLGIVFGKNQKARPYCAVGSVKSNIGHAKVAAGMAGIIKGIMALKHKVLPATMGIETPNARIDFVQSPFYLNTENRPWLKQESDPPRRCGVSAFGFGGTNFHAVIEEFGTYTAAGHSDVAKDAQIFCFGAENKTMLGKKLEGVYDQLAHAGHVDNDELARALFQERPPAPDREPYILNIVATSPMDLRAKIVETLAVLHKTDATAWPEAVYCTDPSAPGGKVCFLFPGQGAQKVNMLRDLFVAFPQCRWPFEDADKILKSWYERPLSEFIYPVPVFSKEKKSKQTEEINNTRIAQPALAATDIAALAFLEQTGLKPDFAVGHSFGEYIALYSAGVIALDDVIRLSAIRGKLSSRGSAQNSGAMAAISADTDQVKKLIRAAAVAVVPANMNTPEQTVVGGRSEDIDQFIKYLRKEKIKGKKLPVTAAFHTHLMRPVGEKLALEMESIRFNAPAFPVFSNTTGRPYPSNEFAIRTLLAEHIQYPLDFISQIENVCAQGAYYFLEVGPGKILSGLVKRILGNKPHRVLSLDTPGLSSTEQAAHFLAQLHACGLPVDLSFWFASDAEKGKSLEKICIDAEQEARPPQMTWRIKNGKAFPCHVSSPSVSDAAEDEKKPKTSTNGVTAGKTNIKTGPERIPDGSNHMQQKKKQEGITFKDEKPVETSLILKMQSNLDQFLEYQKNQQRLMERLLDMQQQLMDAALQGTANCQQAGNDKKSDQPDMGSGEDHHQPIQALKVPPAPALPKLTSLMGQNNSDRSHVTSRSKNSVLSAPTQTRESAGTAAQFQKDLLRTVSELTGYPEEMLDLDANLEADLGVDSIKRVEIFSQLEEHHPLLETHEEDTVLEELAGLNSLRKIVRWYETNQARLAEEEKKSLKK